MQMNILPYGIVTKNVTKKVRRSNPFLRCGIANTRTYLKVFYFLLVRVPPLRVPDSLAIASAILPAEAGH